MSRGSIWATLGVARGADKTQLRRAYAAKLKVTNPEDDPEGFKTLREAYEQALSYVENAARYGEPQAFEEAFDYDAEEEADDPVFGPIETSPLTQDASRTHRNTAREPTEEDRARAGLDAACSRLADLLWREPPASSDALRLAFGDVTSSPMLEEVGTYTRIEGWIAEMIVRCSPASDPLVEPAIGRFGWQARAKSINVPHSIRHVVARQRDVGFIAGIKNPGSHYHAAYIALTTPPARSTAKQFFKRMWNAAEVERLLNYADGDHPTLHQDFDEDAVDAWREYLDKPRLSLARLGTLFGVPLLLAAFYALSDLSPERVLGAAGGYAVWLCVIGLPIAFHRFVFLALRGRWNEVWAWRAPPWVAIGWAVATPLLVVLAVLPPAHPFFMGLMTSLSLGMVLWTSVVRTDLQQTLVNQVLAVVAFNLSNAIFWMFMLGRFPPGHIWQMSLPLLALAIAFTLGAPQLGDVWANDIPRRQRLYALCGLGVATVAVLAACILTTGPGLVHRAAVALAIGLSVVARVPAFRFSEDTNKTRSYVAMAMGGALAFIVWLATDLPPSALASAALLGAALLTVVMALRIELQGDRRGGRSKVDMF